MDWKSREQKSGAGKYENHTERLRKTLKITFMFYFKTLILVMPIHP